MADDDNDAPPPLEGSEPTDVAGGVATEGAADESKMNKYERKARKALEKLGLKKLDGAKMVMVSKTGSVRVQVGPNPEVWEGPSFGGNDLYVVYGRINIIEGEQMRQQEQQMLAQMQSSMAGNVAGTGLSGDDEGLPAMVSGGDDAAAGATSAEGLKEKDIELVVSQAGVSREKAIEALKQNDGDIVNTIMSLTM